MAAWLVVGASGLLGSNFVLEARRDGKVCATFWSHRVLFEGCESHALNLLDDRSFGPILDRARPDFIFFAAGVTDVDYCEEHPEVARKLNAIAPARLSAVAKARRVGFVYVSTDSVFEGEASPYREDDAPNPVNAYAASKLEGEGLVQQEHPEALVVRTNFYGWGVGFKRSYSEWLLEKLGAGVPFPVFSDVYFNPLLMNTLANCVLDLAGGSVRGVVHLGNATPCSKEAFARMLAGVFGQEDQCIRPVRVGEAGLKALRPRQTVLDCRKAEKLLGRTLPPLADELERLRELGESGVPAALSAARQAGASSVS